MPDHVYRLVQIKQEFELALRTLPVTQCKGLTRAISRLCRRRIEPGCRRVRGAQLQNNPSSHPFLRGWIMGVSPEAGLWPRAEFSRRR